MPSDPSDSKLFHSLGLSQTLKTHCRAAVLNVTITDSQISIFTPSKLSWCIHVALGHISLIRQPITANNRQNCVDTPSVFVSSSPEFLFRDIAFILCLCFYFLCICIIFFLLHHIPPLQCQSVSPWVEGLWWSCHLKSGNFIGLLATLSLLITPTTATDLLPLMGSLSDIYLDLWSLLYIKLKKCQWLWMTFHNSGRSQELLLMNCIRNYISLQSHMNYMNLLGILSS